MSVHVVSPVSGLIMPLSGVPDPVFSQEMVGPGIAIDPDGEAGTALAPIDGVVATLHPHAFVIASTGGVGILVHLGIDTVKLSGEGFSLLIGEGETVHAGQPIVRWDPVAVQQRGYSPVCPVAALDAAPESLADVREDGTVAAGDVLFVWH